MVLIEDKKYACEACIKGHRSSSCKHTDRPLFEIKKKGRPVTQCEHCRELRKTKQVHVKCVCEFKPGDDDNNNNNPTPPRPKPKKGNLQKVLATPAFPDGLPASLGAQVAAAQPSSDGSSDSDQPDVCTCKDGGNCHCAHIKRSHRKRATTTSSTGSNPNPPPSASSSSGASHPPPALALSRIGDLRPVLPRLLPSAPETSAAPFQHNHRGQHGSAFFNPYGRAYKEHASFSEDISPSPSRVVSQQQQPDPDIFSAPSGDYFMPPLPPGENDAQWGNANATFSPSDLQILCGCGDACACPGCVQHRGADAWTNGPCTNPNTCNACLVCSVNSMAAPTPTPPTTPSVGYPPSTRLDSFDEWMRGVPGDPALFYGQQQQQQQQENDVDLSSYPAYVSSLDVDGSLPLPLPSSGSFNPYAINVFDEDPSMASHDQRQHQHQHQQVRAMSIDVGSASDEGASMDGLGLGMSPTTRRSLSFSGASPSPREWMALHPAPPPPPSSHDMGTDDSGGPSSYQRPFFATQKAASTTSLLLPSDAFSTNPSTSTSTSFARSSASTSSRSTTAPAPAPASHSASVSDSALALREDFSTGLSEEMESLMAFAAGKFAFGEGGGGYGGGEGGFGEGGGGGGDGEGEGEGGGRYGFGRTL